MTDDKTGLPAATPISSAELRAQDLELLRQDAKRFVVRDRPASDALWTALLRPRDEILRDVAYAELRARLIAEGVAAGLLDPPGLALADQPSALEAAALAQVAKAIKGDSTAWALIADRIEGTPSKRRLDESEAGQARADMIRGIEAIVQAMNAKPGDNAQVIEHDARDQPGQPPGPPGDPRPSPHPGGTPHTDRDVGDR